MSPDDTPDTDGGTAAPEGANRDDLPTVDDYDASDGWQENGLEQCPHCERAYSLSTSIRCRPVYDVAGGKHDYLLDTPAENGPYFCADCGPELERNRQVKQNLTLTESTAGGADADATADESAAGSVDS